jgi:cell wall-associated NlpC family hydrolase
MNGGKSESSTASTQSTETTTGSATGTVGDVLQGQTINLNNELSDNALDAYKQLAAITQQSLSMANATGSKAADLIAAVTSTAAQPDVSLIAGYQKQIYWILGAVVVVVALFKWSKK